MNCPQCRGIETTFNQSRAKKDLNHYLQKGPARTTQTLVNRLKGQGIQGLTLLDIGGGVGAIQHQLLEAGLEQAMHVDASAAYLTASERGATQLGYQERVTYQHGNFVDLATEIAPGDIVTLDRVICCYHDMPALVGASAAKAKKFYGLVYPRETWWLKTAIKLANFFFWLQGDPFRLFVHADKAVAQIVEQAGLTCSFHRKFIIWQVMIFSRNS